MQKVTCCNRGGFTLVEILTAVIIVAVLVAMAAPLYEKTIERSHLAEARTILNRLQESKLFTMDKMGITSYATTDPKPRLEHLNVVFDDAGTTGYSFNTRYFTYSIKPTGSGTGFSTDGVCAKRLTGDSKDTEFYYHHPLSSGESTFWCKGTDCEEVYGLDNTTSFTCN